MGHKFKTIQTVIFLMGQNALKGAKSVTLH
jgi:hypothetical protein